MILLAHATPSFVVLADNQEEIQSILAEDYDTKELNMEEFQALSPDTNCVVLGNDGKKGYAFPQWMIIKIHRLLRG